MQENKATGNTGKRKNQDQLICSDQNIVLFKKINIPLLDSSNGYKDSFRLSLPVELSFASRNNKEWTPSSAGQLLRLKAKIIFAMLWGTKECVHNLKTSVVKIIDDNNKHILNCVNQTMYCKPPNNSFEMILILSISLNSMFMNSC